MNVEPQEFFSPGPGTTLPELVFVRSPRARHYRLTLRRDGVAVATIPVRGSEREARRFVAEHHDWLERARSRQAKKPRAAETWTLGTTVLWRGEMTEIRAVAPLISAEIPVGPVAACWPPGVRPPACAGAKVPKIPRSAGFTGQAPLIPAGIPVLVPKTPCSAGFTGQPAICLAADVFRVAAGDRDLRPNLEAQFARRARIELPGRAWELAAATGVDVKQVVVRNQRTRWGSCSAAGTISLNWRLVQTPDFVRDYIIYHELMHRREMNHSARFWRRVEEVCPAWRDAERWLKHNGSLLGL